MHRRLSRTPDDEGIGLVFVLLVSLMVMIMLATAATALINQVVPTTSSVSSGAAYAAAEAGMEDFLAKLNNNCASINGLDDCTWLAGMPASNVVADPTQQAGTAVSGVLAADGSQPDGSTSPHESFVWKVMYESGIHARVKSIGQVPNGAGTPAFKTRTIIADVEATPSFTNFEYYTKFETYPADFINSFYGKRSIGITNAANSSLSGPGTLTWQGACSSSDTNDLSHCVPAGGTGTDFSTNICEDLYYPSSTGPGRGSDDKWDNAHRRPTSQYSALGTNSTFAYYDEQGTYQPTSSNSTTPETHWDYCDSGFEPNMVMNGPLYSQDAYLVDRGMDTGNSQNSMPVFNGKAYTLWNGSINGVQQPLDLNGGYDRIFPGTNAQIYSSITPQPYPTTEELNLPADDSAASTKATCTYTGPTRVLIKQNYAYITSPGTPSGPGDCYTSRPGADGTQFTNPGGTGVVNARVTIGHVGTNDSVLIYVKNSTDTPQLATSANKVFNLSATKNVPATQSTNGLAGVWSTNGGSDNWSSTATCPSAITDPSRSSLAFDCEVNKTSSGTTADTYTAIRQAVTNVLQASDGTTSGLKSALANAINSQLSGIEDASKPVYYKVTVNDPTSASVPVSGPSLDPSDPFYEQKTTGGYTTQKLSTSISIDRCTGSPCTGNKDTPIVTGAVSTTVSTGSPLVTSEGFPWVGNDITHSDPSLDHWQYNDPNHDVTPYYTGQGDVYVEGTIKGDMTIASEHDVVITNNLLYDNTNLDTTTDGLALVADHNVRIYRPMTCATDDPTGQTSHLGVCPNDLTGVYSQPLAWPLPNNYPALMYTALASAPSMTGSDGTQTGTIDATVFTLRGSFLADNFYRGCAYNTNNRNGTGQNGTCGATVNINGGLYQYHRGPTSLPYQGRPFQGSTTKMPGIVINYNYDNLRANRVLTNGLRVPWVPSPQGAPSDTTRTWNVVEFATGS